MAESMRKTVAPILRSIDRYNPDNLATFERYVEVQSQEKAYDLEANLAVLKLYQFGVKYDLNITCQILLKALTNLPHTDFILCKCLLNKYLVSESPVKEIIEMADLLECCDFQRFWLKLREEGMANLCSKVVGFEDSIRKYVCHVVQITFQTIQKPLLIQLLGDVDEATLNRWIQKYEWKEVEGGLIFIANQDENIKTKNITEKIAFESVAGIMAASSK